MFPTPRHVPTLIVETEFGRIAFEIKHSSTIAPRDLRSLREFVLEQEARVGIVVHNDTVPRQYEEKIIGVPFTHL